MKITRNFEYSIYYHYFFLMKKPSRLSISNHCISIISGIKGQYLHHLSERSQISKVRVHTTICQAIFITYFFYLAHCPKIYLCRLRNISNLKNQVKQTMFFRLQNGTGVQVKRIVLFYQTHFFDRTNVLKRVPAWYIKDIQERRCQTDSTEKRLRYEQVFIYPRSHFFDLFSSQI